MKMNYTINGNFIYSGETSDSSAIDMDVFGSTAVASPFNAYVEDFLSLKQVHLEQPITFRVVDGQLFSIVTGSPNT